jgi:serine/threonine-protein kinase
MALTQQGMVFGTPEFMSPEQACGHPLDGRSDLYALAATMYAMLTGRGLFDVVAPIDWLMNHVKTPPPHLAAAEPGLVAYPELDAALQRCLAKDRAARPATAEAMEQLLAEVAPTLTRPPGAAPVERAARSSLFSASSYFSSLPSMDMPSQRSSAPTIDSPSLTDQTAASSIAGMVEPDDSVAVIIAAQRRRGRMIMFSALAVAGVLTVVAVLVLTSMSRQSKAGSTLPKPVVTEARPDAAVAVEIADAAVALGPVDALPPDASAAGLKPDRPGKPDKPDKPPTVAKKPNPHLEAAEDAAAKGNRLRQLAEADLALRSDPKSTRAKYLLGDALVATGDLDRGCKYLLALKRDTRAQQRARAAGCGQSVD